MESSQFGSERPISCCRVNSANPNCVSSLLVTGCFGGEVRLWDLAKSTQLHSWKAHSDRICGIAWSPLSTLTCSASGEVEGQNSGVILATASSDSM